MTGDRGPGQRPLTGVGKTALKLTPVAIAARSVAFLVPVLIAHLFGATGVTDAFFYALAFPTFIMVIVANAVGTVVTPVLARTEEDAPDEAARFVGGAATSGAVLAVGVGLIMLGLLGPAMPWITDFDGDTRVLTWLFVAELLPFMAMTGAGVILRASCEVRGQFVPVAVAPVLRGSTVMAAIAIGQPWIGAHALPLGMVAGELVQLSWYLRVLRRSGLVPELVMGIDPRLRGAMADAIPLLGGEILVALNVVVDKAFAGTLETGSVSLLEYADRTRFIPQTLLESTLVPVAFATWANLAATQRREELARQIDESLRWVAAWSAPPLAGLHIGRLVLVGWLYERGAFTPEYTAITADAFGWYLPGLWTMMLGALAMRAHVVERRLRLVLLLGIVSVLANGVLDALLIAPLGINGLAMASSLTWVVVPALYVLALEPTVRGHVRYRSWAGVLGVAAASAALAAAVELLDITPTSLADPVLWISAATCFALLGLGYLASRP